MNFNIIILNCNGLYSKLTEIKEMLNDKKADIICLTETWLAKKEPKFIGYQSLWKHRKDRLGGGIGILVKDNLTFSTKQLVPYNQGNLEIQSVEIHMENQNNVNVANFYNPVKDISVAELQHYVDQLGGRCLLMGDLNAHTPVLKDGDTVNQTGRSLETLLLQGDLCLLNPVNLYTYTDRRTGRQSCLDVCLCSNNIANRCTIKTLDDVGSDHLPLMVDICLKPSRYSQEKASRWIINGVDWDKWANDIPPQSENTPQTALGLNEDFQKRLIHSSQLNISKTATIPKQRRRTPWWTIECKNSVKQRRKSRRQLERHPTPDNLKEYHQDTNAAAKAIDKSVKQSWRKFISGLTPEIPLSEAWNSIKKIQGTYVPRNYPLKINDQLIIDNKQKANAFAEHFQKIGSSSNVQLSLAEELNIESQSIEGNEIDINQPFTLWELQTAIRSLKLNSSGLDDIHNIFFKNIPAAMMTELLTLFNVSWATAEIPAAWKQSAVIPILKPKDPSNVASYRPIALLSCTGKLIERLVQRRLNWYIEDRCKLQQSQCGFRSGFSTIDILLRLEQQIRRAQQTSEICLAVYVDLTSAFDTVHHHKLLAKLASMGICGNMLRWLRSYLDNRKNFVRIGNTLSDPYILTTGVPQGGILSPLLFNVMLSDFPSDDNIEVLGYADDITLVTSAKDSQTAEMNMQAYIDRVHNWFIGNGLIVNSTKTKFQFFTRKRNVNITLKLNNQNIECVREHTLLGMRLDMPSLSWHNHVKYLITDCHRRLNLMKSISSSVWGASTSILRTFYIAYIRAKLEYGSVLFAGAAVSYQNKLKVLQNSCLRLLLGARNTTPILSLEIESNIAPLSIRFDFLSAKYYLTLCDRQKNDTTCKLLGIESGHTQQGLMNTFKYRATTALSLFGFESWSRDCRLKKILPPWTTVKDYLETSMLIDENEGETDICTQFRILMDRRYSNYLCVYTDGSKTESPSSVSSAVYISYSGSVHSWKLDSRHSVVGAELHAIEMSLAIIKIDDELSENNVVILTDSKSSCLMISSPTGSYTNIVGAIQRLLLDLNRQRSVKIQWIKAHASIQGNEMADAAAKAAHSKMRITAFPLCLQENKNTLFIQMKKFWKQYWIEQTAATTTGQHLRLIRKENTERFRWPLPRKASVVLVRLRTGHVGLNSYLHRFNMAESPNCDFCDMPEDVEHYLCHCCKYMASRMILEHDLGRLNADMSVPTLLGATSSGRRQKLILHATLTYIKSTRRFQKYLKY